MRTFSLERGSDGRINTQNVRTVKPHSSPAVTCVTDETGTLVATGGADGLVKVWDIRGGFTTHTLHGHSSIVSALLFFKLEQAHDNVDREHRGKKRKRKDSEGTLDKAELDENAGFMLVSGSEDGQMRIWNLQKRKSVATLTNHVSVVTGLGFDSVTQTLLSASRDKTLMIWKTNNWQVQSTIPTFEDIEACGFFRQGELIYAGGERGRLRIWWTKTGQEMTMEQTATLEGQSIVQLLYIQKYSFLLSIHADQTMCLHATAAAESTPSETTGLEPLDIVRHLSGTHDEIIDLAFIAGGDKYLAIATNLEEVRLLSLEGTSEGENANNEDPTKSTYFGADIGALKGHRDIVICLDVDWSGHWLATGAKDNSARLWRIDPAERSFTCAAAFTGHTESIGAIALPKQRPAPGSYAESRPLEFPPSCLLTGSQDKTIKRWDTASLLKESKASRALYTRKAHDKDINALDISHDSRLFASASQDKNVKIWSVEDGEAVGILRGHKRGVWSVRFAPLDIPQISGESGKANRSKGLVLTGSGDKTVKIWNLSNFECIRTFEGHTNSVLKVLWLPGSWQVSETGNGEEGGKSKRNPQIASAAGDGLVKVWDASSGELECSLDNHSDRVWALATYPRLDSHTQTLVSGGGDGVITFWKDTTTTAIANAAAASTERIEQDQELQNLMRARSYHSAITMALRLNHPARLLALFKEVTSKFPPEDGSLCGIKSVDGVLANLNDRQLVSLLSRVRDWNVNAKTAPVAQRVLWTLLKSHPHKRLENLRGDGAGRGSSIKDVLDALTAYTERHYRRMEELMDESYLVEYTLGEMEAIGLAAPKSDGVTTNGYQDELILVDA